MPLGSVDIDEETARSLIENSEFLESDPAAHAREHCIEVQVPFIQYFSPAAKIVPVLLRADNYEICQDIANAVFQAVNKSGRSTLIVASTDMTHYESHEYAKRQDQAAIDEMLEMDAKGLISVVIQRGITMCGAFPTAAALLAAKKLGAKKTELVKYATSGDVSGDNERVVGYAGLIVC
jgi:MEMO1 family protein